MMKSFVLLAACAALPAWAAEPRPGRSGPTQPQLREAVRKAIRAGCTPVVAPSLGMQDDTLMFRPGGLQRQHSGPRIPLDYPLQAQFTVELIREQLAPKTPGVDWDEAFLQAEAVIDRQLSRIRETQRDNLEDLRKALDKDHQGFLAVFERALQKHAGGRKVLIVVPKAAGRYKVTVKLDPPEGGRAFYLSVLEYEILRASGGLDDDRNWYEVADSEVRLGGEFHFRGRWPGDRTRITGVIDITQDRVVTVSW